MPLPPTTTPPGDETPLRGRDDACPGALRLHPADDGALARVRVPAGFLTARQALVLALAAEELGDGRLDLTSRGNLQLRGLDAGCGADLAARLRAAGLLPSDRYDRVRNIVASPLSGLDGVGHADAPAWARGLDALLREDRPARSGFAELAGLSGRFLFAFDDGRGDVAALGADVTLIAEPDGGAVLRLGPAGAGGPAGASAAAGAPATAGAPTAGAAGDPGAANRPALTADPALREGRAEGDDTPGRARPSRRPGPSEEYGAGSPGPGDGAAGVELRVRAEDAPRAAALAAVAFLDAVRESGTRAWRVRDLLARHAVTADRLARRLAEAGIPATPVTPAAGVAGAAGAAGTGVAGAAGEPAAPGRTGPATPKTVTPAVGVAGTTGDPAAPGRIGPATPKATPHATGGPAWTSPAAQGAGALPVSGREAPPVGEPRGGAPEAADRRSPEGREGAAPGADRGQREAGGVPVSPPGTAAGPPSPGLIAGPGGRCAVSVAVPLGRLTAARWRLLAELASRGGSGELRVTPWRGVVLPGFSPYGGRAALRELADAGLVTTPHSPWLGVTACTGRPGCAKSLADVRADAERAVARGAGASDDDYPGRSPGRRPPVHFSGCERRCGHPGGRWIDVLATGDGYRVAGRGTTRTAQVTDTAPDTGPDMDVDGDMDVDVDVDVTAEQWAGAVAAARETT
ncbi:nitrite reductase [Streptomyces sparsogenes]|uniref:nitrite reductase n=1 Tax=Streptomyces sparsogenes TaxID=67365 RepID=UPI0033DFB351